MPRLLPPGLLVLLCHLGCQECCNDHDCAVRAAADGGDDDFCVEGACVAGAPDVIETDGCGGCDGPDQQCVDGACVFAPSCLRLDKAFVARRNGGAVGSVVADSDGCTVIFAYDVDGNSNTASVERIERDGTFTGPVGMLSGSWSSATRTGVLVINDANRIDFGTDSYACVVAADCADQVFGACVDGVCAP